MDEKKLGSKNDERPHFHTWGIHNGAKRQNISFFIMRLSNKRVKYNLKNILLNTLGHRICQTYENSRCDVSVIAIVAVNITVVAAYFSDVAAIFLCCG